MELPQRYGHYVLLERIAVGGMGEIFRAKYAGLAGFERLCAIKRILPHLSDDPEFVDRLISEAMIAVQLSHTNIVQVYELGKIENEYFIAMEWVDGPDLSTLQVRAKAKAIAMTLPLAIHVVHEVARALDHAHRKTDAEGKNLQIVHRDISPQNVMLTMDGAVKLGDFGIARAGGIARRFATGMGAVLGKRRYMSPEQRRGENVDARTDVYALGALLFEGITGNAPDPEAPIPPLSTLAKDISPELDALCAKALAFDPKDRTETAGELAEGLERVFVRLASASSSRAVRDPGPELGRFVRKVCPPGEKLPQKRSLTSRIRAAMRPGAQTRAPGMTPNLTQTPSGTPSNGTQPAPAAEAGEEAGSEIASLELPHGADGVTIVRSAIIPAAVPDSQVSKAATVAHAKALEPIPPVMPAPPSVEPTLTASKPAVREDETVLEAARAKPSEIDTDRGPALGGEPEPEATVGDGTETVPAASPSQKDLGRSSRASNAETMIQPHPDLTRGSRGSAPRTAPDITSTAPASNGASSAETVVAPLLPTGASPRLADAPAPDLARSSRAFADAPTTPPDPTRGSRGAARDAEARAAALEAATTAPVSSRAAVLDAGTTAPNDLVRGSRGSVVDERAGGEEPSRQAAAARWEAEGRASAIDVPTAPPDLSRPSQRAGVAEARRARVPSNVLEAPTREDGGELFPTRPPPSSAPYFAGGAAVLVAITAIALWSSGVFDAKPGTGAVATPTPVAVVSATPRVTPTRRPTPERTTAPATPRPTPERTPTPRATPTAARTKIAIAPTATPAPKTTPRPPGTGVLVVNAKPWARVTVDGREIGVTPIKGVKLAAGSYKVVLEHPSFGRIERNISLKADETEKLIIDFKSLPGEPAPGSP